MNIRGTLINEKDSVECFLWQLDYGVFLQNIKDWLRQIEGNDLKKNKNRFFTSKSRCEKSIFVVINGCYCL